MEIISKMSAIKCTNLVLKVASRCNLNCSYCYMYNLGDNTYLNQPKFMNYEIVNAIIDRVEEHCKTHGITKFHFVFHGGEPLLIQKHFYSYFHEKTKKHLAHLDITFSIQTNGILLNSEWASIFDSLGFHIGISLDGNKYQNDKFRIYHNGNGSYDDVIDGIKTIQNHGKLSDRLGLLSVVDISCDPVEHYTHYKQLGATFVSFLLRDSMYDEPLDTKNKFHTLSIKTPFADWMIAIFNEWYDNNDSLIQVQPFRNIIKNILGDTSGDDALSGGRNEILVIETNGTIEAIDVLKICGNGFTKNNSNVQSTPFDIALDTELAMVYNLSHKLLPKKCLACPVNDICGGGYLPHRYSSINGFNNPSIYCNDLMKLITHIQNKVVDDLPQSVREEVSLQKLTYEECIAIIEDELPNIQEPDYIVLLEKFKKQIEEEVVLAL